MTDFQLHDLRVSMRSSFTAEDAESAEGRREVAPRDSVAHSFLRIECALRAPEASLRPSALSASSAVNSRLSTHVRRSRS